MDISIICLDKILVNKLENLHKIAGVQNSSQVTETGLKGANMMKQWSLPGVDLTIVILM